MKESKYLKVLNDDLLSFWSIYQPTNFMQKGAPAHRIKFVTKWFRVARKRYTCFRVAKKLSGP